MVLAHRNLISLYDMSISYKWVDTIKISDDHVRQLQIKKRPIAERIDSESSLIAIRDFHQQAKLKKSFKKVSMLSMYQIQCLVGSHTVAYTEIMRNEKSEAFLNKKIRQINLGGRVLKMMDDRQFNFGVTILTDNAPETGDFDNYFDSLLYKFPLEPKKR